MTSTILPSVPAARAAKASLICSRGKVCWITVRCGGAEADIAEKMINMFGAPSGGSNGSIGGDEVSGSLASYVVRSSNGRSEIGNWCRHVGRDA